VPCAPDTTPSSTPTTPTSTAGGRPSATSCAPPMGTRCRWTSRTQTGSTTTSCESARSRLWYTYDGIGLPWLDARPPMTLGVNRIRRHLKSISFSVSRDAALTMEVSRATAVKSQEDVLVVDGANYIKFNVGILKSTKPLQFLKFSTKPVRF
jgi:hypothetical protein